MSKAALTMEELTEALRAPVLVPAREDAGADADAVYEALSAAWRERVPGFGVQGGQTNFDRIGLAVGVAIVVLIATDNLGGERDPLEVVRVGVASHPAEADPWRTWQLAFRRASELWGLRVERPSSLAAQLEDVLSSGERDT